MAAALRTIARTNLDSCFPERYERLILMPPPWPTALSWASMNRERLRGIRTSPIPRERAHAGGMVLGGRLHRGKGGSAMEIGHITWSAS